jgi:hypothetical protein
MLINDLIKITEELKSARFPDAQVIFLAGSYVRGEATPFSDLDLVIVYDNLSQAYRESFYFQDIPVECFVHDPETLTYFFYEVDRLAGSCSLANMVMEGIAVPHPSPFSQSIKQQAASVIESGPPELSENDIDKLRYQITNLIDDLRQPRTREERMAIGTELYDALANYYLRINHQWAAKGKAIPRAIGKYDADLNTAFHNCFAELFVKGQVETIITLTEEILKTSGGFLFEGYKLIAPEKFRKTIT